MHIIFLLYIYNVYNLYYYVENNMDFFFYQDGKQRYLKLHLL